MQPDQPRSRPGRGGYNRWGAVAAATILLLSILVIVVERRRGHKSSDLGAPTPQDSVNAVIHQPETRRDVPDPADEGWSTEAISERAKGQLKRLAKLLTEPQTLSEDTLREIISKDFSCGRLLPIDFETVYQQESILVRRATINRQDTYHGVSGMLSALRQLSEPFRQSRQVRASFKIFEIENNESSHLETRQFFSINGRTDVGMIEQNAVWRIRWSCPSENAPPTLEWIGVESLEEVTTAHSQGPLFADCTNAVLGSNESFSHQMMYGNAHWCRRVQKHMNVFAFGHHGLAVGDVNGDGLDDVYRCQGGGVPNRLYLQQIDGSAVDHSAQSGVDFLDSTRSSLIVDLDNDGDQDMVLAFFDAVAMLENDGHGRFQVRQRIDGVPHAYTLASADYDLDADLDVYVCVYYSQGDSASDFPVPVPYFDARNGGRNLLLRNDQDWRFTDVTDQIGLKSGNNRFSYAAAWEDYDNDGDADLYVANDFGRNNLYRNDDGYFTDVANTAGLEDSAFGMSVSFGDFNRDGHFDVYVGNMFSAAGNRITTQDRFRSGTSSDTRSRYRRLARGNTLFANNGDGSFRDVSLETGVTMGRWSWSSLFADLNNDGWEDLLVANGFITGEDPRDL